MLSKSQLRELGSTALQSLFESFLELPAARPSPADILRCVLIINHFLNGLRKGILSRAASINVPALSWASLHLLNVPPPKPTRSWWMKNKPSFGLGWWGHAGGCWLLTGLVPSLDFSTMSLTKDISTGTSPCGKGLGGMLSHICTAEHSWRGRQGPPAHSVIRKPGITKLQIKLKKNKNPRFNQIFLWPHEKFRPQICPGGICKVW